jgi:heme-degrading monooxygenase HmoA
MGMAFIQIIEYETDRFEEIAALMGEMDNDGGDAPGFVRGTVTKDRDNPRRYLTIVEFESYETAMANSDKPETGEMAAKLAALCSGPPRFHNLDVVTTFP